MIAFLSLGTNLGDKEHNLNTAIQEIEKRIGTIEAQSAFLVTEPWGFESDNSFLNAAVRVRSVLTPLALLNATQAIERSMGRRRKSRGGVYHDRIIDIDLLMCFDDDIVAYDSTDRYDETKSIHLSTPRLILPHPLMNERDFVLIPLSQIK